MGRGSKKERWAVTVGGYEVSDRGRVRDSTGRMVWLYRDKRRIDARLLVDGVYRVYRVHRLVAEAFVPNPNPERYRYVMLRDKRSGPVAENLRWCSRSEAVRAAMARIPAYRRHWNTGRKSEEHKRKISEAMRRRGWRVLDFDFLKVKDEFVI